MTTQAPTQQNAQPQNSATPAPQAPPAAQQPPRREAKHDASILDAVMTETEKYRLALEPTTLEEAHVIAVDAYRAKLVESVEEAKARILIGRAIGIPAMASIMAIALIENKRTGLKTACMYAKLKLGLLQSRTDVVEYIEPREISATKSVWVGKRKGRPEVPYEFTMDDAVTAGLWSRGKTDEGRENNNYTKHPKAMLSARACGRVCDIVGADILNGLATREEIEDENKQQAQDLADSAARGNLAVELARGDGSIDAAVGTSPAAPPPRDFEVEAAELKSGAANALTADERATLRSIILKWAEIAPKHISDDVKKHCAATWKAMPPIAERPRAQATQSSTAMPTPKPTAKAPEVRPEDRGDAFEDDGGTDDD